ncbi:RnfABCDGE type electron transport complex subunit D [Ruminococcaceae bacterium OttesenSCG-928-D13]|nr:RnfABCDGE type electron transport complex subunit D [Ruminococcaceae bacterium OttesenSCG-928-D13]
MEDRKLIVSPSPHILSKHSTTRNIMLMVVIALLPTLAAAAIIFGWEVLLLTGVTVAACVGFETLYCVIMKKKVPVGDFSAVVTGLILAFNLPPSFPLWMAVIGAFVAIVIVKQLFGGIGFNFANPALVGRIVLQLSFTGRMITYIYPQSWSGVDALATATPMYALHNGPLPLMDLLLGTHAGVLGETCALTLIIGGAFLIATKVISPVIPLTYVGGVFAFKFLLGLAGGAAASASALSALSSILAGGLLLGAFFMATDYTTSPYTRSGKFVYGLLLAIVTTAIREWAGMVEGVSYALLLCNLLVPYINELSRQRPMGVGRGKRKGAA